MTRQGSNNKKPKKKHAALFTSTHFFDLPNLFISNPWTIKHKDLSLKCLTLFSPVLPSFITTWIQYVITAGHRGHEGQQIERGHAYSSHLHKHECQCSERFTCTIVYRLPAGCGWNVYLVTLKYWPTLTNLCHEDAICVHVYALTLDWKGDTRRKSSYNDTLKNRHALGIQHFRNTSGFA